MFFHLLSLIRFLCDESFIILFKCNCDNCHRLLIPYMQYWINYGIFLATYQYLSNDLSCQYYGQENTDKDLDSVYPYNAVSSELLRLNILISVRQNDVNLWVWGLVFNATFSNISAISFMATSFSGGRNQSTRREPLTMGKQLVNFITCGYESNAPFLQFTKPGANPAVLVIGLYELLGNPTT